MTFLKSLFRTKPLDATPLRDHALLKTLTAVDLTLLGVGAIIGAGVFVLTGIVAATQAGPGVIFSYILAGLACAFSAFAYAELSSSIGGCGSAYGYSMAGFGEIIAWLIGWDLLLEYAIACSVVAIGWSGYVKNIFSSLGLVLPVALSKNIFEGGFVDLPAVFVVLLITVLLAMGIRQSTWVNRVVVFIKLLVIALFIFLAIPHFNPKVYWQPFLPFGWSGIVNGASMIFFAYIGFDAVSTAAEEAINPKRDLPIGIISSLAICTAIYVVVAALLTGAVHYETLNVASPVSFGLIQLGYHFGGAIVAVGAIAGLSTVILVMFYGLTRVMLAITRDGLLPKGLSAVNPKTKTPLKIIYGGGAVIALVAGFVKMEYIAALINIGTLFAFALVCLGVVWMRFTKPNMPRPFKTPFSPLVPALGFILCGYLMFHLPAQIWKNFGIWMGLGLVIYFIYGRSRSVLNNK